MVIFRPIFLVRLPGKTKNLLYLVGVILPFVITNKYLQLKNHNSKY